MSEKLLFPDVVMTKEEKKARVLENRRRYSREYHRAHKEQESAKWHQYRAIHKEELLAKSRARYAADPEKARAASKAWRDKNPEQAKERYRKWMLANREYNKARCKHWNRNHRAKCMVARARRLNRTEGLPFDLEDRVDDIQKRIDLGICELSGIRFDLTTGNGKTRVKPNAPSIDRIVPEKGYVYSNIRIIAFALNLMFMNWGEDVVKDIARGWLTHNGKQGG